LCPSNKACEKFNNICLDKIPTDAKIYLSNDRILNDSNTQLYPIEFLNSLDFSGLPAHKLI
jgi:hypothetical protein